MRTYPIILLLLCMLRIKEAVELFLKPFGLSLPKKASPPVICLVFPMNKNWSLVSCPFFCAIRNAKREIVHCYKLHQSPRTYELHYESHMLPEPGAASVKTLPITQEGSLTSSSVLAAVPGLLLSAFKFGVSYHSFCLFVFFLSRL